MTFEVEIRRTVACNTYIQIQLSDPQPSCDDRKSSGVLIAAKEVVTTDEYRVDLNIFSISSWWTKCMEGLPF